MSSAIAVQAGCHDVQLGIGTTLRSRVQMLGRALEQLSLARSQPVGLRKRDRIFLPHGQTAVVAAVGLAGRSPASK